MRHVALRRSKWMIDAERVQQVDHWGLSTSSAVWIGARPGVLDSYGEGQANVALVDGLNAVQNAQDIVVGCGRAPQRVCIFKVSVGGDLDDLERRKSGRARYTGLGHHVFCTES